MTDYLTILERADDAYHDVAQLHLHEFAPTTDGGRDLSGRGPSERDWRETAYLTRSNWPEAIPNSGPRREHGPCPWSRPEKFPELDERDSYPPSHPDAASIGPHHMGDVCPYCGVPLKQKEIVVNHLGKRGALDAVTATQDPGPAYHVNCWKRRRGHYEASLHEFMSGGGGV